MAMFSAGAQTYASLVAELNGRFAPLARSKSPSIDRTVPSMMGTKFLIVLAVATVAFGAWANWHDFENAIEVLRTTIFGIAYTTIGQICLFINLSALGWQVILASRYRPWPTCTDEQLPSCTVVVPAYNEGRMVLRTLRSIARSDYPAAKLQIIAIDDGSKDDTWLWILKAARELPGIITIKQPRNMGKKHAMYEAFKKAAGNVFVTIDSDSLIEQHTIRRLVSPLYHDNKIGAVAGNVRVLNQHEGLIPRMLEVSFAYSFEFIRTAQSSIRTVFCTPGALAAYRRTAVMPILEKWLQQTFCGKPARIGEDRAMTNWILRSGHDVVFQSNAVVYTNVPAGYDGLCKMFLRWARSNVRESIMMSQFIFERFRASAVAGARTLFLLSIFNLLMPQFLLTLTLMCLLWKPGVFIMPILLGSALGASISAGFYAHRRRSSDAIWAYAYSFFWAVALFWITGYALLTASNNKWLSREQKPAAESLESAPTTRAAVA
jgi:hyaluronan synthase